MTVRAPRQARSSATWERVLDAGVEILEHDGHEALTIARVCARAGVVAPSIYARVPDKEALLQAIHRHAVARLNAPLELTPGPAESIVAEVARAFLDNAALLRAIIRQAGSDPVVFRAGSLAVTELGDRFRAAVGGDPRRADACFGIVVGALAHRIVDGADFASAQPQGDAQFVADLSEMAAGYLT
jgi:AcrR family transcriptional regulator